MKLTISLLLIAASLLLIPNQSDSTEHYQTYIIHVLRPCDDCSISNEDRIRHHRSFLPTTPLASGEERLIYSYSHAISGFAARLTPNEVRQMEHKKDFLFAVPDFEPVKPQTTYTHKFLGLDKKSGILLKSKLGEGIIIAIIDTGVDPDHLSFADDGTLPPPPMKWQGKCDFPAGACNNKLIGAVAYNNGLDTSPLDDSGHGTHVASTAAGSEITGASSVFGQANGDARGIASRAHLAVYKVNSKDKWPTSDIIKGMDSAISDGVDVINLSLGEIPKELYQNSLFIASFAAMQHGIFVSAAAGNYGPGDGTICNDAPWMLTVTAGTTDRRLSAYLMINNFITLEGESVYFSGVTTPLMQIVCPIDCSHMRLSQANVKDKIVVCFFSNQIPEFDAGVNVKSAGGNAMVMVGKEEWGVMTISNVNMIPTVYINHNQNYDHIQTHICSSVSAWAQIYFHGTMFGVPYSPSVAALSSRGPSMYNGGILKPDVMGPGVSVLAARPNWVGPDPEPSFPNKKFNFMTGTSMAAPHLSGIAAMIKKVHPEWSVAAVKSAIMTTAYSRDASNLQLTDQFPKPEQPATYLAMGAGHVNVSKVLEPGLVYDIDNRDYIGYLCGLGYKDQQVMAIVQIRVSCADVQKIPAEQLNYPSISLKLGTGTMKSIQRTVTNVGRANSIYIMKYKDPDDVKFSINPSMLWFTGVGQKRSFTITFYSLSYRNGMREGEIQWVNGEITVRSPVIIKLY